VMVCVCFFLKQRTAYDVCYGLVGSEMGIRDSSKVPASSSRVDWSGLSDRFLLERMDCVPILSVVACNMGRESLCEVRFGEKDHAGAVIVDMC